MIFDEKDRMSSMITSFYSKRSSVLNNMSGVTSQMNKDLKQQKPKQDRVADSIQT
jgi:hypothetical protein